MQDCKKRPQHFLATIFCAAVAGSSLSGNAETLQLDVEPGLWQHSFSIKTASGELERAMQQLEQQLASMPAAQRQMMEKMMASQGMSFDLKGSSVQVCLTQQQIDRGQLPQQDGCQQQINQTGDNSYQFSFSCDTKPPTSGEGEMTFSSRKAYSGSASFTTEVNGKAEKMTMQQSGKWLKADCG
ncbi:DUF3617 domain-containing protein [Arsukibacterium sp.]|uniref:DUF3617 domain-containing protein n=1 Tax=Arsukibacterium sp. TaxID=1977258 RepID=UPI00299D9458|nr:DUF3617 domain-containing protein [Arsukibacterium sp.]MDX1537347.1 DUF3617 domain-containing protein [Arsukibacterium sp.]